MAWIFWAMGAFTMAGFPGFVKASEGKELRQEVADLKSSADIAARISLSQEIRLYQRGLCTAPNREAIERAIERLQTDYERIVGSRYPDRSCE